MRPIAVIPLKLDFNSTGDHGGGPHAVASHCDQHQSPFGRLFSFLTGEGSNLVETTSSACNTTPPMVACRFPMLRLDTKYRMHKEIADWPAR
jgi:hypothetical protein